MLSKESAERFREAIYEVVEEVKQDKTTPATEKLRAIAEVVKVLSGI